MDNDLFTEDEPTQCNCGHGWCPNCGTFHLSDEQELLEVERRVETGEMHGCRSGHRVIRKKIGGDE